MLKELEGYDWENAFAYAGESEPLAYSRSAHVEAIPGEEVSVSPFARADVEELIGLALGEKDGDAWVCAGRLTDGRWFCLSASCDYTGWDCQASGMAKVALTREGLVQFGMSEEERTRCGL